MYQNSKIYKLVNNSLNLTYYGSTTQPLAKRFYDHERSTGNYRKCKSADLFASGECKIYLVEEFPCETREELLKRERYWIDNNECVNKCRPCITEEERKAYKKEWNGRPENLKKVRDYKERNKQTLAKIRREKVECDKCGKEMTKYNLKRHQKLYCPNV